MRLLASLIVTLLLVFSAARAENSDLNLRTVASQMGLPETVEVLSATGTGLQGGYWRGGIACVWIFCGDIPEHIVVITKKDTPRELALAILAHEIGHYDQKVEGVPTDEWDADRRGIVKLCRLGLNGPGLSVEVLSALTREPGIVLDSPTHGNLYARIENSRARDCSGKLRAVVQTP